MIRVMVADDNIDINNMYCKFLTKDKDIKIISQTTFKVNKLSIINREF